MESIKIPSPSAILDVPSSPPPASNAAASSSSRPAASSAPAKSSLASTAKPNTAAGQTPNKPKQSKSRNGTILDTSRDDYSYDYIKSVVLWWWWTWR